MNENQLKKTLDDIHITDDMQERLIAKCTQIKKSNILIHYKRALHPVIVCALFLIFSFSTVFAFSTDFREYVISFFKSEQVETPPVSTHANNEFNSNNYIRYIGHQEIENIADIKYYEMKDGFLIYNGYLIVAGEYYKIDKERIIPVTPVKVNDSIRFRDHIFDLDFMYMIEDSQIQILENKSTNIDGKVVSPMWTKGTEFVWMYIGVHNEIYTCIQYNLKTGEIIDIIKESGLTIEYSKVVNGIQTRLSPSGKNMLIHNFEGQAFLLDTQDLSYISLDALNIEGMELSLSFIDDQTLSIKRWKEDGTQDKWLYTFSSFDLKSKEERILLSDVPDSQRGRRLGVWGGSQQEMLILVEKGRYVLVDPKTGEQYPIEGLRPNPENFFLRNPDNKKIVVTTSIDQEDLGITKIGYIDMEKREFKVFDRKDFSDSGMFWIDNSKLALLPTYTDDTLLCIYEFK